MKPNLEMNQCGHGAGGLSDRWGVRRKGRGDRFLWEKQQVEADEFAKEVDG